MRAPPPHRHDGAEKAGLSGVMSSGGRAVHSPGPLVYPSRSTIGLDSTKAGSKFKAPPSFSFGTEDRFAY